MFVMFSYPWSPQNLSRSRSRRLLSISGFFFFGTFEANSQIFREVECTELFCTDPVNHLWGQSFIDHWTYSWAHASIGDGHGHDTIFLSVQGEKKIWRISHFGAWKFSEAKVKRSFTTAGQEKSACRRKVSEEKSTRLMQKKTVEYRQHMWSHFCGIVVVFRSAEVCRQLHSSKAAAVTESLPAKMEQETVCLRGIKWRKVGSGLTWIRGKTVGISERTKAQNTQNKQGESRFKSSMSAWSTGCRRFSVRQPGEETPQGSQAVAVR